MTSKIRILSDQTINQIAAGEVIENPASVIKELVENAIDAGASQVTIEVLAGGFQWIKISDNGSGMSPEDAVLSLERHATSKIISAEDLFSLATMGFRGEALASIAAISKMHLTTALENAPAISLEVEGGKISHAGPAARARGTTIEVRSLFYNVPARKKFQKSAAASSAEITKIVTQLALAHPEIGIELIQQNRSLFSFAPASPGEGFLTLLKTRASLLLSEEFLPSSRPLTFKEGGYEGQGLIADPLVSRHNRSGQYLFVNRRPVFCLPIAYAVRDAYGTRLNTDRHPIYVLHLTIPPTHVDVNVHPQKKEIRLREESMIKYALHSAVNASLGSEEPPLFPSQGTDISLMAAPSSFSSAFKTAADFIEPLCLKEEDVLPEQSKTLFAPELNIVGFYGRYLLVDAKSLPASFFSRMQSRAAPSGVVWCDLPAIEARIQFDALMRQADLPLSQGLLMPITLSFSRAEAQLFAANLETIHKLGLQMRQAGDTVFMIEGIPPFLEEGDVRTALEELIAELQGLEKEKPQQHGVEKMRKLAGCLSRRIRSRKRSYSLTEARHLVEQLMRTSDPYHCPQGKLTLCHISEDEIEKYFLGF